jgi:hypothetical protein
MMKQIVLFFVLDVSHFSKVVFTFEKFVRNFPKVEKTFGK